MISLNNSWTVNCLTLLFGFCAIVYIFVKRKYSYWDRNGFKTLPGFNYVFGHLHGAFLQKAQIGLWMKTLYDATTEPFIGIYGIFRPILLVRDPDLVRLILIKDFSNFTDRGNYSNEEYDPLSGNLFTMGGQKWKHMRASLTPTFTSGKLKAMFNTLNGCGSKLQNHLDKTVAQGEMLDVRDIAARFTTNVIASIAFGIEIDTINNPNNEFRVCGRNIFEPNFWNVTRSLIGLIQPKLMNLLRLKLVDASVEKFIKSVVKETLDYREQNNVNRKDFFQMLIQLRNSGSVHSDDQWDTAIKSDNEKKLTLDQIAAQTFVFFAAGFESSSSALSFCLYELTKNPELQQRVQNEIDRVLEQHNGLITYESISQMSYLKSCIDETLRKYPLLPILNRTCMKDYQIPGTNKIIPKGMEIFIPAYAFQRDEQYYDQPEKFDPDRFNAEHSMGRNMANRPYMPFGNGPRSCIAIRLGKLQTKVGLVLMLQKFRFELEENLKNRELEIDVKSFLLSPLGRINLHVFKR